MIAGVIEGFYGPPWTHEQRLDLIEFCGREGLNTWVHAPKDDPYHRKQWKEPYPEAELARLGELVEACGRAGLRFAYAIAPGLSIDYGSDADFETLLAKVEQVRSVGVGSFQLLWDDIERTETSGVDHCALTNRFHAAVRQQTPLVVCPMGYAGSRPTEYRTAFATGLHEDVVVYWTGPEVVSLAITRRELDSAVRSFAGHELLIWDNYPVNDWEQNPVYLAPFQDRDPRLVEGRCAGVIANAMVQAIPSKLALATIADWCRDPRGYDPLHSFERALREYGDEVREALGAPAKVAAPADLPALVEALEPGLDPAVASALLEPFV
jgi:hyaluronoglucosaminidase